MSFKVGECVLFTHPHSHKQWSAKIKEIYLHGQYVIEFDGAVFPKDKLVPYYSTKMNGVQENLLVTRKCDPDADAVSMANWEAGMAEGERKEREEKKARNANTAKKGLDLLGKKVSWSQTFIGTVTSIKDSYATIETDGDGDQEVHVDTAFTVYKGGGQRKTRHGRRRNKRSQKRNRN